jgi:hypothetical protein
VEGLFAFIYRVLCTISPMQLFSKGNHGEPFRSKKSRRPVPSKIKLFSFLIAFILLWPTFLAASVTDQPDSQEEESRSRTVYFIPEIVEIKPGGSADAALKIYQEWEQGAAKGAKVPAAKMIEIYKAAGGDDRAFKNIAFLIQGGEISPDHSVDMAEHRERWIEEIVMEIGKDNNWLIGRSDSGNTASGMKSDLDQTLYLYERSSDGKKFVRAENLDKVFIDLFNQKWQAKHPDVTLQALDIASIEGKNRFPDPRDTKIEFSSTFRGTIEQLRNTPGAYTYQGAVVQQMQFRALNEIIKENTRSFQRYGPSGKKGKWKKLPFDGEEAMRTMFGIEPELMPAHALGAALANFLELQHYMGAKKFETKYHLRTWEDAMLVLWLAERGLGKDRKLEYIDLEGDQRSLLNEEILERLFPDDPTKQKLHEMALDISADLRLLHKNKLDEIESFKGHSEEALKSLDFQEELIFKKLAQDKFDKEDDKFNPDNPDRRHIEWAREEHRKLASEFCLESIYQSSKEAFKLIMDSRTGDPFKMDQYWHLTKLANDPKSAKIKENLKEAAHLTFLYGLYDLGAAKSYSLLKRLKQEFPTSNLNLFGLWLRGRLQGIEGMMRTPDLYLNIYGNHLRDNYLRVSQKVQTHILYEIGFENVDQAKNLEGFMDAHHLSWRPGKLIRNMANDPGNIDALAQIVRAYVESREDMDKVAQVAVDEIIMAIPVFGQIVSASKADLPGLFLMGAAMYSPAGAGILLVHSVGQAGYAIYDLEYAKPMAGNIANGIYRGYIGPETRFYGNEPEPFTDEDKKRLAELRAQKTEAYAKIPAWHGDTDRRMREWSPGIPPAIARARAEYEILANQLKPEIDFLERKKKIRQAFDDDPAYGGFTTGAGAQWEQKLFENYILKDLKPIISFSPAGIIDFRAEYDPVKAKARLEQLKTKIKEAKNFDPALKPMEEYQELSLQKARFERAQRYLKRATGQSEDTAGMTEVEARLHAQALMHKLQRDSLYPWLTEKGYTNTEEFINDWVKANETAVIEELVKNNLLSTYVQPRSSRIFEGDQPPIMPSSIPEKALTRLKEQMYQDYMKSAELYQDFLKMEKLRNQKNEIRQENRIDAFRAQAAGLFVQQIRDNPEMKGQMEEILMALRLAAIKRNPPEIEATVYHKPPKKAPSEDSPDSSEEENEFTVSVKIKADPQLYYPPYHTKAHFLNKDAAQRAAASGTVNGIPLSPDGVTHLKQILKTKAADLKNKEMLISVVSVFASGMADLTHAIPETVSDLPVKQVSLDGKQLFLLGESLGFKKLVPEKPKPVLNFVLRHNNQPVQEYVDKVRAALPIDVLEENIPGVTYFILSKLKERRTREASLSSISVKPAVHRVKVDIEKAKKRYAAAKSLDWKPHLGYAVKGFIDRLRKNYLIRTRCKGQTNYLYVMAGKTDGHTYGGSRCLGLTNGQNTISVSLVTEDGERFTDSFNVKVKTRPATGLNKALDKLHLARKRMAKFEPRGFRYQYARGELGGYITKIDSYARMLMKQGQGMPNDILPLIREKVEWGEFYLKIKTDPQRNVHLKDLRRGYFNNIKEAIQMCSNVGGMEGFSLAKSLIGKAESSKEHASDMKYIYSTMANLAIAAANDVATARGYLEKSLVHWKAGGLGHYRPLTEDEKNSYRKKWPVQMGIN